MCDSFRIFLSVNHKETRFFLPLETRFLLGPRERSLPIPIKKHGFFPKVETRFFPKVETRFFTNRVSGAQKDLRNRVSSRNPVSAGATKSLTTRNPVFCQPGFWPHSEKPGFFPRSKPGFLPTGFLQPRQKKKCFGKVN